ncbi:MAG: NAD-dependent epimerase/dehydratase family protein [Chloroflexota bacterium]
MSTALVTGGTGFVGSHVVRALIENGHQVRVLLRNSSKRDALKGLSFEPVIGALDDPASLRAACTDVDIVYHIAAIADYWRADPNQMRTVNVEGTRQVLAAARDAGVRRVVFTSSAAAVGLRDDRPADENERFNLKPEHFPYGYSKKLAEDVVAEAVAGGQDVVIVNPVVIMGPGDLNMISGSFMLQIKRFGHFTPITSGGVAVVDVRDVAHWHMAAAEHGITGQRYILGTANYTYREWFDMIANVLGTRRPRLYAPDFTAPIVARMIEAARRVGIPTPIDATQARMGIRKVYFDFSRTWQTLGKPQIDMMQSLQDTYDWYREHGYL